jgi:hypothetical protein
MYSRFQRSWFVYDMICRGLMVPMVVVVVVVVCCCIVGTGVRSGSQRFRHPIYSK